MVDSISETSMAISYMKQTDQVGCLWAIPEDAEIRETTDDQILHREIKVEYRCTSIIRCFIPLIKENVITEEL